MSSFIKLTVVSGAMDEKHSCYLLEIDQARILLDCGWNEKLQVQDLVGLAELKDVDALLLSHADISHIGAYPFAFAKLGLSCPSYSTTPVHDMGNAMFKDLIKSKRANEDFNLFNIADVHQAMSNVNILRYSQPISLKGKAQGITVTPFGSGHTIGGTIWKIRKDTEDIIYTIDYNHRKERHLNGSALLTTESLLKPSLLITDSLNAVLPVPPPRKERDRDLIENIMQAMDRNANVLIPIESTTRILELAYLLEGHWAFKRLSYHLLFLTHESNNTINLARSMLEWMGDSISQAFAARELPFDFKYLKTISSLDDVERLIGPKVILASFPGMEFGFSRHFLIEWGVDPNNLVILTDRGSPDSLSRKLFEEWNNGDNAPIQLNMDVELEIRKRIPLEGEELELFQAGQMKEEELQEDFQEVPSDSELSDMDEDTETTRGQVSYDTFIKDAVNATTTGFFKQHQAFKMFPVSETRPRIDDYGEVVDPAEFKKFEVVITETEEITVPKEVVPEIVEVPSKFTIENQTVALRCKLHYIDFEGRSDGKAIRNILQYVLPKRIVFVHGTLEATQSLKEFCMKPESGMTQEIYTPLTGQCVDVFPTTNIYQVVLTDSLVSSMKVSKLDGYKLGYVSGVIRAQENTLTLDLQPFEEQKYKLPVSIGEVKLSELKKQLGARGFSTQFVSGGVLVVNDTVVIRKTAEGKLAIQGQLNEDYYQIRNVVYTFQAML